MQEQQLSGIINNDYRILHETLKTDINFDIGERKLCIAGKEAYLYTINGFAADDKIQRIIHFFLKVQPEEMPQDADAFIESYTPFASVKTEKKVEQLVVSILSGIGVVIIDGYDKAIVMETRDYPGRGVEEPEKDKVLRGARDGFSETIITNTALIRRRIRDPKLRMEIFRIGDVSKTDVVLTYLEDKVDQDLLSRIKLRIRNLEVHALTMSQESLAECLYEHKWYNPFPKFKYTERPDTTVACILEGNLVIMVDNSPAAMVLPSSIFDIAEAADDYYFPPITGTYLRISRLMICLVALMTLPVYLLLMQNAEWIPPWLDFIKTAEVVNVPLILQILILELAVDGLRLAAVNTPSMLSTPLSIIAGLVLGDFSVQSGWFNSEIMLYMAFVTVANYTQTSYELSYAIKFLRLMILILTAVFNVWGFIAGVLLSIGAVVFNKTIAGTSYIYPLIPFRWSEVKKRFFRPRLSHRNKQK